MTAENPEAAGFHTAVIAIGSNLGRKVENCRRAIAALEALPNSRVTDTSRFYRTAPVGYRDQDWFINAAVVLETALAPLALLRALQGIQRRAGRKRQTVRFGPRILDLDIIFYDDAVIDTPELTLPHPRMHERRFVLQPICDMNPAIFHPVLGECAKTLLDRIDDELQIIEPCACD
jgi:2-amino-4-hydroxy-6-hydroxymethyldihydropteridine diphosphokinase